MSKISAFLLAISLFFLSACDEKEIVGSETYESTSVVEVHGAILSVSPDWNHELKILGSDEVLTAAAIAAGTSPATLDQATRFEADVEGLKLRIIATAKDLKTAKNYASSLATAFAEARASVERKFVPPATDQDRITYEKAKKALQENPLEEAEELDAGVLFQKKNDE